MTYETFDGVRKAVIPLACIVMTVLVSFTVLAEDSIPRPVIKDSIPFQQLIYSPPDKLALKLGDILVLTEKANAGNPLAQHELGLGYLAGGNFPADTVKAAYWIEKAAKQNLVSARYNMGILLNNGWGVPWNPFEAYKHFQYASQHGMKEAQYIYGLLLTDHLVVARNYQEAYRWIAASANAGYTPAKEVLVEFEEIGITAMLGQTSGRDTVRENRSADSTTFAPSALTVRSVGADSSNGQVREAGDEILLREALSERPAADEKNATKTGIKPIVENNAMAILPWLREAARVGSPEALVLLGRWYETGRILEKDDLLAAVYYLRAVRNHSNRAPVLLLKRIHQDDFFDRLKVRLTGNDALAKFVWADLVAFGFDGQLTEEQVISFLNEAAAQKFPEAALDLGLMVYSGKWAAQDREKGKSLLLQASQEGSREADVRLWMLELGSGGKSTAMASLMDSLQCASNNGSIIAQEMLGYCYQKGIGVVRSVPSAVRFYRKALRRGSKTAYYVLKGIYDELRPKDPEYIIEE